MLQNETHSVEDQDQAPSHISYSLRKHANISFAEVDYDHSEKVSPKNKSSKTTSQKKSVQKLIQKTSKKEEKQLTKQIDTSATLLQA